MLKRFLTSAAMSAAFVSSAAFAGGADLPQVPECMHCFKSFVGIYYSYLNVNTNSVNQVFPFLSSANALQNVSLSGSIPDTFNGLGFMWGGKYGPYFGFATGMTHYFEDSTTVSATLVGTTQTINANVNTVADLYFAEGRGYLPLMEGFDLIGAVGAALLEAHTSITGTFSSTQSFTINSLPSNHLTWRFGAGADYYFTQNWGVEAMFHYMPTSGDHVFIEDFWTANAGVNYLFS